MLKIRQLSRPGLEPVDLDVAEGACVTVHGPSGSGKSLMLRAIADLDPNIGEVTLDGRSRESMPAPEWRGHVIYVPAEAGWWSDRVTDHFPDPDFARPLVRRLGLPAAALDWDVARLSTGERQRLALVRALNASPSVLLLDEPTSGLDPEATSKVESVLHEKLAQGAAMVMVTHDADQAKRMSRTHYRMMAGHLTPAGDGGKAAGRGG